MRKTSHWLIILTGTVITVLSCSHESEKTTDKPIRKNADSSVVTTKKLPDPTSPTEINLQNYFADTLDFSAIKKELNTMHSMGGSIPAAQLPELRGGSVLYHYGAFRLLVDDRLHRKIRHYAPFEPLIVFAVDKPWDSPKEKYYTTDNEILLGFKSLVKYDGLGSSDLVGKEIQEILEKFGEAHYEKKNCLIYRQEKEILVLKEERDKVKWLKRYTLRRNIPTDSLNERLFHWPTR